jgi:hypothetical protein
LSATPAHKKYIAALCHMKEGALHSYDSEHLLAVDNTEAIRKATEWRVTAAATIDQRTWVQVLLDGSAIYSEELGTSRRVVGNAYRLGRPSKVCFGDGSGLTIRI